MSEGASLINLGDLAKPADTLILKISEAIGGIFKPFQIKRVAKAEAEADKIKALSRIEIDELQQRALVRFVSEETKKQENMEGIISKALPNIQIDAKPEEIENDWISNFFDKCRLISDDEMQIIWANILAGEANKPGTYSKRTVNFMSSIDKEDAMLFAGLCSFMWNIDDEKNESFPIVFNLADEIYEKNSVNFSTLTHLDNIGLIVFNNFAGYLIKELLEQVKLKYFGKPIIIKFLNTEKNELDIGEVILTQIGAELCRIVNSVSAQNFFEYTIEYWRKKGLTVITDVSQ